MRIYAHIVSSVRKNQFKQKGTEQIHIAIRLGHCPVVKCIFHRQWKQGGKGGMCKSSGWHGGRGALVFGMFHVSDLLHELLI